MAAMKNAVTQTAVGRECGSAKYPTAPHRIFYSLASLLDGSAFTLCYKPQAAAPSRVCNRGRTAPHRLACDGPVARGRDRDMPQQSLSHTGRDRACHVVWIPKYRRKAVCAAR